MYHFGHTRADTWEPCGGFMMVDELVCVCANYQQQQEDMVSVGLRRIGNRVFGMSKESEKEDEIRESDIAM